MRQLREVLRQGRHLLDPILFRFGFSFEDGPAGRSCGGAYASGTYVNGNRKLELHYRWSLGLVSYHFRETTLGHESYMHALLGTNGGNKYPGFSDDPMDAFKSLAYDHENFATAFLNGDFEEFASCVAKAEERKKLSGFARLP